MRLDRILSNRGYCARSDVRDFLSQHRVALDAKPLTRGDVKLDINASLTIDDQPIDPPALLILLNKPAGLVCSHDETEGPRVYDLFPQRWLWRSPQLTTVGRLDKMTTGLLILCDDGALVHRLTHPKHHVDRVYTAALRDALRGDEVEKFASGKLKFEDDDTPLKPAKLDVIDPTHVKITVHEGRYHQVRKMFELVNNEVLELHRESYGSLQLGSLAPGAWRPLDRNELFDA